MYADLEIWGKTSKFYNPTVLPEQMVRIRQSNEDGVGQAASLAFVVSGTGGSTNGRAAISAIQTGPGNGTDLTFQLRDNTGAVKEHMRLKENGHLGIGSDTAPYPLTVQTASTSIAMFRNVGPGLQRGLFVFADNDAGTVTLNASGAGAADMLFSTGNVEKARLNTGGNLLVGKSTVSSTTVGAELRNNGEIAAIRNNGNALYLNRQGAADGTIAIFAKENGQVGNISVTGSGTAYNTSSDYRLKEDLQDILTPADRLMQLHPVNVSWKANGKRSDTFIAHELAEVLPYAVTGKKDALDPDGNPEYQSVDYSKVVPLLTAALQEALTKIENLETRINAMESQA